MKRKLLTMMLLLCGVNLVVSAATTTAIRIEQKDGSIYSQPLTNVRSVAFNDDALSVYLVDASQKSVLRNQIRRITFGEHQTDAVDNISATVCRIFATNNHSIVATSSSDILSVCVMSITGTCMYSQPFAQGNQHVEVSAAGFPQGMYIVAVETTQGQQVEKVLIR